MEQKDKVKILVVDDIPANIIALKSILSNFEIEIFEANSGNDALALTLEHDFALVLLDVQMPEMTGYEVAEMMRSVERTRRTPIIFVTANSREEVNELKAYDVGAVDYITKPINKAIIRSKVRTFIEYYQLNQSLERAKDTADRSSRLKSEFLANMSHEIRTPMNGILGSANLLSETPLTEEQAEYVSLIRQTGEGLLGIINDILDFSKIEAGKMTMKSIPFAFSGLLLEVSSMFGVIAEKQGIQLLVRYNPSLPDNFLGDSLRIRQILVNLVVNAIKFTHEGYVLLDIHDAILKGDVITLGIRIVDTGIGIAEDKLDHIFNKFSQADSPTSKKHYGGTGLGLTITRNLVELMNGNIYITSKIGEGSTVHIEIDLKLDKEPEALARNIIKKSTKSYKCAVITSPDIAGKIMQEQLVGLGHKVNILETIGEDIKSALFDNEYDIIFVDGKLANKFLDVVETLGFPLKAKFIVLSSLFHQNVMRLMVKDGKFHGIITKPILIQSLAKFIEIIDEDKSGSVTELKEAKVKRELLSAKIMVVEDNKANQLIASHLLKKIGCNTVLAENGEMAVELFKKESFDLIFMDCQMPIMDGFEACKRIRNIEKEKVMRRTPIIALSANVLEGDREMTMAAGMDDFLPKPTTMDNMHQMIRTWTSHNAAHPEEDNKANKA